MVAFVRAEDEEEVGITEDELKSREGSGRAWNGTSFRLSFLHGCQAATHYPVYASCILCARL